MVTRALAGLVAGSGRATLSFVETVGALSVRLAVVARALVLVRFDVHETARQTLRFAKDALPLVLIASVAVGGVVAMQGLVYIRRYAATEVFGWAAFLSSFRDVGPMLIGFCLAARTGCRNAAEVASMAARERLDALRALGLDPDRVVILPRVLATTLTALLLFVPACAVVVVTGFGLARLLGDQSVAVSVWSVVEYSEPPTVWMGLLRMALFGTLIGFASCQAGLRVERDPEKSARAIGGAVYRSSVVCMGGIVALNLVVSLLGGTS